MVQWLRLCASTAGGTGSNPGEGTKIPNASRCGLYVYVLALDEEKAMAPHSSTLAWRIPWTEEPGRLQFMEL